MKRFGLVLLAVGLASLAQAADFPSGQEAAAATKPNCWASPWDWLNSSANDCPLSAYGVTIAANLDLGVSYLSDAPGFNPSADKLGYGILRNANGGKWLAAYNALSTTVIGLTMNEDLAPLGLSGWSLIGVVEAGVNPYSGMLDNGPRTLADNNLRPARAWPWQNFNADSSRAGQWDNSQGFVGVSHPDYGTLTFGRSRSLAIDAMSAYDPAASNAFSLIGFSSAIAGFGATETVRPNTAFTYRLNYQNIRGAAQVQLGGYDWGNGSQGMVQGQIGVDFGPLSLDGVLSWTKDAVALSSFGGSNAYCVQGSTDCFVYVNNAYYNLNTVLKATLSHNAGAEIAAKYRWNAVSFYVGYLYASLQNPSDGYLGGFPTIAQGVFVPTGAWDKGVYANAAVNSANYNVHRVLNTFWTGFRWSVLSNLDVSMGFYYQAQNNYNFTVNAHGVTIAASCTGAGPYVSSPKCAGGQSAVSLLIDYRPVKRIDLYAGVMVSNVYGGLASGFYSSASSYDPVTGKTSTVTTARTQEWDPTVGVRISF